MIRVPRDSIAAPAASCRGRVYRWHFLCLRMGSSFLVSEREAGLTPGLVERKSWLHEWGPPRGRDDGRHSQPIAEGIEDTDPIGKQKTRSR